jgi:hypothetical protein
MAEVTLHPLLAKRAASRQEKLSVTYLPGLTPKALRTDQRFSEPDAEAVMVLRSDTQIESDTPLNDGVRVDFMVRIQGGNGEQQSRHLTPDSRHPASDKGASPCAPSS